MASVYSGIKVSDTDAWYTFVTLVTALLIHIYGDDCVRATDLLYDDTVIQEASTAASTWGLGRQLVKGLAKACK